MISLNDDEYEISLGLDVEHYLKDTREPKGCHSWDKASEGGYVILCDGLPMEPGKVVDLLDAYFDLKEQVERTAHLQAKQK